MPSFVEVRWRIDAGHTLPLDCGYPLASALFRELPWAHDDVVQLVPPRGRPLERGSRTAWLTLTPESRVAMRVHPDKAPLLAALVGRTLEVDRHMIRLGAYEVHPLRPSRSLYSRIVIIRHNGMVRDDPEQVWAAVARQVASVVTVPGDVRIDVKDRRVMRISDSTSIGYAVYITGLTESDSVKLQAVGLGGRRRFGAGVLVPAGSRGGE